MDKHILKADGITKTFGDSVKTQVLFGIDFSVERGSFTTIIGPSGSGKSTLLNVLSFLERPTSGEITIDGTSLSKLSPAEISKFRNAAIGFVFQFHYLLPEFTALENVLIPVWINSGYASRQIREQALLLMRRMGIEKAKGKYLNQISGGEQQRVAIARALINNPGIVFADEPTGNLDRETSESVLELMKDIIHENGTTLIMVTHDRDIALKSDFIIELIDGRICRQFDLKNKGTDNAGEMLAERTCGITI
jgi:lipoprotein-releasing system ATP-binding protein